MLLGVWGAARIHREVGLGASLHEFEAAAALPASPSSPSPSSGDVAASGDVDVSLWSAERIREFRASVAVRVGAPLAVLRIPKIGLVVPVLEGTDELVLNRGVGHIEGTALPGRSGNVESGGKAGNGGNGGNVGNVGIAGHRDGFFRGLKDVAVGDRLELDVGQEKESFRIESLTIVRPEDVWVLDPTDRPTVTLVTCYPFYFVGSAPSRFIVRAVRAEEGR